MKGAPVDTMRGRADRASGFRVETPQPSDVKSVVEAVAEVAAQFDGYDRVGITFPGVVLDGVTRTAANVDKSWLDAPAGAAVQRAARRRCACSTTPTRPAWPRWSSAPGKGQRGLVVMLTFGTGIGSALFIDGTLIPTPSSATSR